MGRYVDYNGSVTDYDLDDYDPFTTKRSDRYFEYKEYRQKRNIDEDEFDGDWDD